MEHSVERTDGLVGKGKCDFEYLHFLLKVKDLTLSIVKFFYIRILVVSK